MTSKTSMTAARAPCGSIDKRLAYRIGYPMLPILPVKTSSQVFTPVFRDQVSFDKKVKAILCKLVEFKIHGFVHRFPHGTSPTGTLTFLVTSTYGLRSQADWSTCVVELRELIFKETRTQTAVEIVDKAVAFRFPPPKVIDCSQEDIITAASKVLSKVVEMICQHQWISIDILRWYFPDSVPLYQPAIVICARDASETLWWSDTLPKIRELLYKNGSHLRVALLFLDSLSLMIDKPLDTDKPNTWQKPDAAIACTMYASTGVNMGASIGRKDSEHSGTLGGAVQLKKDGETYNCGLTNCHVLLADTEIGLEQSSPPDPDIGDMKVMSPSDKDHTYSLKKRGKEFKKAKTELNTCSWQWCEVIEKMDELQRIEKSKEKTEASLNEAKDYGNKREIGTIYAASGYTTCSLGETMNEYGLDWSLIRLHPHSKIINVLSDFPGDMSIPPNTRVDTWMPIGIREKYRVAKRGRSSQWTIGKIGSLRSIINSFYLGPEDPSNMEQETIKVDGKVLFNGRPIVAHCIVGKGSRDFLKPGDSGALALLAPKDRNKHPGPSGTIVGLCYASNLSTRGAYMMSMEAVIESINKVTGGTVTFPRKYVPPASR
ncbi:hypothetical protein EJ04DRAFT_590879 [Polyplosphaeria fusca]|uniref:Uncharacterized protein n=1 Tax=Polyplosphaeria fusca TaxID=682080 RepID=A0A9P4QPU0_9PLEO|nr:hypothetical protein EJ04DRAFT_590879 [Polyplosphaeria fusca]